MFDPLKNPTDTVRRRAQREIELLLLLQSGAMTQNQIADEMNINPRTIKSIVFDLKNAGVVHRPLGTHRVVLDSGEFFHLEPDPEYSWTQT